MINLIPHNLHWLKNVPPEHNLFVHKGFTLSRDKKMFINASGEELNLSAAVIFMLRTIEMDHSNAFVRQRVKAWNSQDEDQSLTYYTHDAFRC